MACWQPCNEKYCQNRVNDVGYCGASVEKPYQWRHYNGWPKSATIATAAVPHLTQNAADGRYRGPRSWTFWSNNEQDQRFAVFFVLSCHLPRPPRKHARPSTKARSPQEEFSIVRHLSEFCIILPGTCKFCPARQSKELFCRSWRCNTHRLELSPCGHGASEQLSNDSCIIFMHHAPDVWHGTNKQQSVVKHRAKSRLSVVAGARRQARCVRR